jgi:DNA-binding NarL/FixJ family response regulator
MMPDRPRVAGQSVETGCPFFVPKSKPELSERERQTLVLVAAGHTDLEIAQQLLIGHRTAKQYVQSLIQKMGARNRASAVMVALAHQLIRVDLSRSTLQFNTEPSN